MYLIESNIPWSQLLVFHPLGLFRRLDFFLGILLLIVDLVFLRIAVLWNRSRWINRRVRHPADFGIVLVLCVEFLPMFDALTKKT